MFIITTLKDALTKTVTVKDNSAFLAATGSNSYDLAANGFDVNKPIWGYVDYQGGRFSFSLVPSPGTYQIPGYYISTTYNAQCALYVDSYYKIRINQLNVDNGNRISDGKLYLYRQS